MNAKQELVLYDSRDELADASHQIAVKGATYWNTTVPPRSTRRVRKRLERRRSPDDNSDSGVPRVLTCLWRLPVNDRGLSQPVNHR